MKAATDFYAISEAHAHALAYRLHVDELTATLAQLAGNDIPTALVQVEGLQMMGKSRLEALGATIRLYRSAQQRAANARLSIKDLLYTHPEECQMLGERPGHPKDCE